MASKAEVIAFLKSNYKLEEMSPGLFSMLFEQENGRTQMLFAGVFDSFIRVDSPFGALGSVDIPSALDDSSILGLGAVGDYITCLLYTSPSPRDRQKSRMPSSA